MPLYKILCQKHADWTASESLWREVSELYAGGYTIRKAASHYLKPMVGESQERYQERLREASYIGYLGQIVDFFGANLFTSELVVTPPPDAEDDSTIGELPDVDYYTQFAENCDRKGSKFSGFIRETVFTPATLKRRAIVGVDFPVVTEKPATLAEEDALGNRAAYLYAVPVESLINWAYDETGNYAWATLHRTYPVQSGPLDPGGMIRQEWKVWSRNEQGQVIWQLYAVTHEHDNPPKPETEIPLVAEGGTSFPQIPLVEFSLVDGLWIGNKIGPLACEHFRRRSTLNAAESRSLFEVPVYKLGSEIGAQGGEIPSDAQQNPHRAVDPRDALAAKGYVVLGADDELQFIGPSGAAYGIVDKQLSDLKDEMFRVVHQMAAAIGNGASALGRSGMSKQEDRRAEAIVLGEFGRKLREFAVKIYTLISSARGEDTKWVAHGLDRFVTTNRLEVMQEATQVANVPIPSPTFKKLHLFRLATALVDDMQPATQAQVQKEINEGVDKAEEQAEHMHEIAEKAARDMDPNGEDEEEEPEEGGKKPPKDLPETEE